LSGPQKRLRNHATTCIKNKVFEAVEQSENNGLAFDAFCDREDCWGCEELIAGHKAVVNIRETGYTLTGEEHRQRLDNGKTVCVEEAELSLEVEVYANGCEDTIGWAMSVQAEVMRVLHNTETQNFCVKSLDEDFTQRDTETDYADQKTKVTTTLRLRFFYAPSDPSQVFGNS